MPDDDNNFGGSTPDLGATGTASTAGFGATTGGIGGNAKIQEGIDSTKEFARQAVEDLRGAAHAKVDDLKAAAQLKIEELRGRAEQTAGDLRGRAEDYYGEAKDRARSLQEDGEAYVRENPARAVLTALGAGFMIGLLFRR